MPLTPTTTHALLAHDLKRVFGYDTFRPLQREIMEASLSGHDVLAILPTGAGKSLCYQLPALARSGLTVVASPLIALMKDQVDQMKAAGVAATFLNSTLDGAQLRKRETKLDNGEYRILYVAPERLVNRDFLAQLRGWNVEAFAVDEAHCISEWGHDFRPEYRQIATARDAFPNAPIIALTATATERVRDDIVRQLRLRDPQVFLASFDRPNLMYRVEPKASGKDGTAKQIIEIAARMPSDSGIVYCQSRKATELLTEALTRAGHTTVAYHAGLDAKDRARNQEAFLRDEVRIVCATIAFGMGINKPNVRFVAHADLPKNIEGYYQETGRAGRDGLPAECVLLYSRGDVAKHLHFLAEITDQDARNVARKQLEGIVGFAESAACRREELLGYFGETYTAETTDSPSASCGACDNCLTPRSLEDVTIDAQKLMSCVLRVQQKSGFNVGMQHLAEVLCGANTEKIRKWNHETLSTYGAGKSRARLAWIELGRQLLQSGLLELGNDGFAVIMLTKLGADALRSREPILVRQAVAPVLQHESEVEDQRPTPRKRSKSKGSVATESAECDQALFDALRVLRKQLADARGVPPYVVFGDVSLTAMARSFPGTKAEFLAIPGVGEKRYADFGAQFTEAIAQWIAHAQSSAFDASQ